MLYGLHVQTQKFTCELTICFFVNLFYVDRTCFDFVCTSSRHTRKAPFLRERFHIIDGYRFNSGMMFLYFLYDFLGMRLKLLLCLWSQDMISPKDPYIQVRVHKGIAEVPLGDHSVSLAKSTVHFLRAWATRANALWWSKEKETPFRLSNNQWQSILQRKSHKMLSPWSPPFCHCLSMAIMIHCIDWMWPLKKARRSSSQHVPVTLIVFY
jgi:hypothetical protein